MNANIHKTDSTFGNSDIMSNKQSFMWKEYCRMLDQTSKDAEVISKIVFCKLCSTMLSTVNRRKQHFVQILLSYNAGTGIWQHFVLNRISPNKSSLLKFCYTIALPYLTTLPSSSFKPRKGYFHNEECLVHNEKALQFHDHNMILPIRTRENMSKAQNRYSSKSMNKKHYR
jgi:hypothetical protein